MGKSYRYRVRARQFRGMGGMGGGAFRSTRSPPGAWSRLRGDHTCAAMLGGEVRCWGRGHYGKLGNGSTSNMSAPVTVAAGAGNAGPLQDVIQVAPGDWHTCALLSGGEVRCWGNGGNGRLGDGTNRSRTSPVAVVAGDGTTDALQNAVQDQCGGLAHLRPSV